MPRLETSHWMDGDGSRQRDVCRTRCAQPACVTPQPVKCASFATTRTAIACENCGSYIRVQRLDPSERGYCVDQPQRRCSNTMFRAARSADVASTFVTARSTIRFSVVVSIARPACAVLPCARPSDPSAPAISRDHAARRSRCTTCVQSRTVMYDSHDRYSTRRWQHVTRGAETSAAAVRRHDPWMRVSCLSTGPSQSSAAIQSCLM